jgi:hypothetical protein
VYKQQLPRGTTQLQIVSSFSPGARSIAGYSFSNHDNMVSH